MSETITVQELADALDRRRWPNCDIVATQIFDDVKAHREPEWQPGDVVEAANGKWYRRTRNGLWLTFGNVAPYSHEWPERPLTKRGPSS